MYAKACRQDQKALKKEILELQKEIVEIREEIKLAKKLEKMQPKFKKNDVVTNKTVELPIGSILLKRSERDAHCWADDEGFLYEEFIMSEPSPSYISMRTVDCIK